MNGPFVGAQQTRRQPGEHCCELDHTAPTAGAAPSVLPPLRNGYASDERLIAGHGRWIVEEPAEVASSSQGDKPPGMYDVARAAGVSHQTVSRVLNDHASVRPETRARVLEVIDALGYRRNSAARALVTRRSGTIGVVTTRSALYGPTSVLLSVEAAARENGYFVSIVSLVDPNEAAMRGALEHFMDQLVEGVVVIGPSFDFIEAALRVGPRVPMVTVSALAERPEGIYVTAVDHFLGARMATAHLLELGHTEIAHISGPEDSLDANARVRGWRAELESAGLRPGSLIVGDWTAKAGYAAGQELLRGAGLPKAVFAGNDEMALGLLRALTEHGVRVPKEVSVVGFDDIAGSAFFAPPLTTIKQDFTTLGERCMDLLLAAMAGTGPTSQALVRPQLLLRASTAPPIDA